MTSQKDCNVFLQLWAARHRVKSRTGRLGPTTRTDHLITGSQQKADGRRKNMHQTGKWNSCKYQQAHNDMQLEQYIYSLKMRGRIRAKINKIGRASVRERV